MHPKLRGQPAGRRNLMQIPRMGQVLPLDREAFSAGAGACRRHQPQAFQSVRHFAADAIGFVCALADAVDRAHQVVEIGRDKLFGQVGRDQRGIRADHREDAARMRAADDRARQRPVHQRFALPENLALEQIRGNLVEDPIKQLQRQFSGITLSCGRVDLPVTQRAIKVAVIQRLQEQDVRP
jgi:hypothetical protein